MGRIIYFFDKCKCFLSFVRLILAKVREIGEGWLWIASVPVAVAAPVAAPPATVVLWGRGCDFAAVCGLLRYGAAAAVLLRKGALSGAP